MRSKNRANQTSPKTAPKTPLLGFSSLAKIPAETGNNLRYDESVPLAPFFGPPLASEFYDLQAVVSFNFHNRLRRNSLIAIHLKSVPLLGECGGEQTRRFQSDSKRIEAQRHSLSECHFNVYENVARGLKNLRLERGVRRQKMEGLWRYLLSIGVMLTVRRRLRLQVFI